MTFAALLKKRPPPPAAPGCVWADEPMDCPLTWTDRCRACGFQLADDKTFRAHGRATSAEDGGPAGWCYEAYLSDRKRRSRKIRRWKEGADRG